MGEEPKRHAQLGAMFRATAESEGEQRWRKAQGADFPVGPLGWPFLVPP
jgi:hypothetical protein